jgi:outer membrane protein OmpA-like peptidoglycan-associated protein
LPRRSTCPSKLKTAFTAAKPQHGPLVIPRTAAAKAPPAAAVAAPAGPVRARNAVTAAVRTTNPAIRRQVKTRFTAPPTAERQRDRQACSAVRRQRCPKAFIASAFSQIIIGVVMRCHLVVLLLSTLLSACSGQSGQHFPVFFQPYDANLDSQAQESVHQAASFAKAHPLMPLSIIGLTPYMGVEVDTMSGQRTQSVLNALLREGIGRMRIEIVGSDRLLDPNGMPNLPAQRVDIYVGF